ncbi:hypothetical protein CYMTET_14641 [Cymbomonas tetramitiformis]|uniref:Uncharacterized protein n=1 Tax=Cymbomonas tetramitiformis TaxID=36881 RepID=A0AAE0L9Q8_9CHLO|nr:hypothetical protein CYMTET_14641 [Cymbomonas tetramitiformis]
MSAFPFIHMALNDIDDFDEENGEVESAFMFSWTEQQKFIPSDETSECNEIRNALAEQEHNHYTAVRDNRSRGRWCS